MVSTALWEPLEVVNQRYGLPWKHGIHLSIHRVAEHWVVQFINLVSGSTLSVSDGLKSCTSEVLESRPFALSDDQSVILIDTPGFDDTTRPDTDIISTISTYLANM